MSNVIIAALVIAMILGANMLLANATFSAADNITIAWDKMMDRKEGIVRTELTLISVDPNASSTDIDVSVRNSGQTSLGRFEDWDVVIRYYSTSGDIGLNLQWMSYVATSTPATLEWTVEGIYSDATTKVAETYEPNLLNPGEEMIIRANVTPAIPGGTNNSINIGTSNGVSLPVPFSR